MKRKEGKKKRYLGRRRFGRGNVKNRRGSGNRGGRGAAGRAKHHFTWVTRYDRGYFGKSGFQSLHAARMPIAHLYEIQQRATNGALEKKEGRYYMEFHGKVLGTGILTLPVYIKARSWSKGCEAKVKKAGGLLEKIGG